jgi:uncharacterized protein (DUF924 family)
MTPTSSAQQILDFWFAEDMPSQWFANNAQFDQLICDKFSALHQKAVAGELAAWENDPQSLLALVILFDQFSRNMFRDTPAAFASDATALRLTKKALAAKMEQALSDNQRAFLYMPLMHSENLADQALSVKLFADFADNAQYAKEHYATIAKFGRFPHRNAILNRASTEEELAFLSK